MKLSALLLASSLSVTYAKLQVNESRTFEVMLPTRDGVELHTRVVLPRDDDGTQKYTTIVDRSPYGYLSLEWIPDIFLPAGFATVGQDMRGTEESEGLFSIFHSDANDSEDLGNWIVEQSWSDGNVYSFGASADGLGAFTMVMNQPSWLSKQYFIWTSSVGYPIFFPQGTETDELIDSWIHGTVDGDWAEACMQSIKRNEYFNPWWDAVDLTNKYDYIHGKSAFWAGWYDLFLVGNLAAYEGYNTQCQEEYRYTSMLTIDPLGHCQSAAEYFPQDLIAGRTLLAFMQAVELYGIHDVARTDVKNVTFYVMSSNDDVGLSTANYWTSMEVFPTPKLTSFYFHSDGSLSTSIQSDDGGKSSYTYDPVDPVPTVGGNNLDMPCGPLDQAEIDQRSDVLTFQTSPLTEALPLTGPLDVTLYVGSDAIDTDFMVRLSDVYPTGEVRLIQDSGIRMRWREGGEEPVYMSGDSSSVYEVTGSLWNTSYVVAEGHSVRVAVTSSNYPRFSANPNNGKLLKDLDQEPYIVANNILHHSQQYPSHISLPVVDMSQLPKLDDIKSTFRAAIPNVDPDALLRDHPDLLGDIARLSKKSKK